MWVGCECHKNPLLEGMDLVLVGGVGLQVLNEKSHRDGVAPAEAFMQSHRAR